MIASFLGEAGEKRHLFATDGAPARGSAALRRPTLEEPMLGYLAAGRPNLLDRVRAGKAGH